jgi:hypothetical protein
MVEAGTRDAALQEEKALRVAQAAAAEQAKQKEVDALQRKVSRLEHALRDAAHAAAADLGASDSVASPSVLTELASFRAELNEREAELPSRQSNLRVRAKELLTLSQADDPDVEKALLATLAGMAEGGTAEDTDAVTRAAVALEEAQAKALMGEEKATSKHTTLMNLSRLAGTAESLAMEAEAHLYDEKSSKASAFASSSPVGRTGVSGDGTGFAPVPLDHGEAAAAKDSSKGVSRKGGGGQTSVVVLSMVERLRDPCLRTI